MKLIDRYVGWQVLLTSTIAVAVLSVVLVLGNIFKQLLELLVKNDTPFEQILTFLAYILPFSLTFTIPWGFLTAVLLVFGKMSAENELIALRANGVSIPRITLPVLVLAVLSVGVCLWINVDVAPRAQAQMKEALYTIATQNPRKSVNNSAMGKFDWIISPNHNFTGSYNWHRWKSPNGIQTQQTLNRAASDNGTDGDTSDSEAAKRRGVESVEVGGGDGRRLSRGDIVDLGLKIGDAQCIDASAGQRGELRGGEVLDLCGGEAADRRCIEDRDLAGRDFG